jgi:hypothetical protein
MEHHTKSSPSLKLSREQSKAGLAGTQEPDMTQKGPIMRTLILLSLCTVRFQKEIDVNWFLDNSEFKKCI